MMKDKTNPVETAVNLIRISSIGTNKEALKTIERAINTIDEMVKTGRYYPDMLGGCVEIIQITTKRLLATIESIEEITRKYDEKSSE